MSILIFFVIAVCLVIIIRSNYFAIKTVDVQADTNQYVAHAEVLQKVREFLPSSIFSFPQGKARLRIVESFPAIQNVQLERQLPDTVVVRYAEYVPVVSIKNQESWYLVSDTGVVFFEYKDTPVIPENVPFVNVSDASSWGKISVGEAIDGELVGWLVGVSTYPWADVGLSLTEVFLETENSKSRILQLLYVQSENRMTIALGLDQSLPYYSATIQIILRSAQRIGKVVTHIDLRFDRPVVRYL